jgi:phage gp46-like protein
MAQDLLIKQTPGKGFDLVLGEQDFETVDGMETTIAVLLFTDARAAPSEVPDPEKRRGWVGNILRSSELGGMLWLMTQARNTQEVRNKIVKWARNSLQPLLDEGMASEIIATVDQTDPRGIRLSINIIVKNGESTKYPYWLATNLGNLTNAN